MTRTQASAGRVAADAGAMIHDRVAAIHRLGRLPGQDQGAIVQYVNGDKADLKPGAKVFIGAFTKLPDGSIEAAGINVGKDGVTPPM